MVLGGGSSRAVVAAFGITLLPRTEGREGAGTTEVDLSIAKEFGESGRSYDGCISSAGKSDRLTCRYH